MPINYQRLFFFLASILLLSATGDGSVSVSVKNFHQVSDELYRSAQPSKNEMKELERAGIRGIINLRNCRNDMHEMRGTSLKGIHVPMRAKKVNYEDVLNTMIAFRDAPKPMLVHCRRGSDRTGCMVAIYRIVFMGWTKERAIEEFRNPDYGYLEKFFPNLVTVIENLDIEKLRADLSKP